MLGMLLLDGIVVLKMIMVPTYLPYKIIYLIYHVLLLQTIHSHASYSSYPQKRSSFKGCSAKGASEDFMTFRKQIE
jgi:hypothetical protein